MKGKIVQLNPSLEIFGGAEKIILQLHEGFTEKGFESYICSLKDSEKHCKAFDSTKSQLFTFSISNLRKHKDAVFLSHSRKITTLLLLLKKFFFPKLNIVHVTHNEFNNLKFLTLFPQKNIAVSQRVKQNMVDYFRVDADKIDVIYNGIRDEQNIKVSNSEDRKEIRILYPARVNEVKQQINLVTALKDKLNTDVKIVFAGDGPDLPQLQKLVDGSSSFSALGFRNDILALMSDCDYVMLFSKKEGLPVSLIEACMLEKPCICNDVGGNTEIVKDGINGFVIDNIDGVVQKLNSLSKMSQVDYELLCTMARSVFLEKFSFEEMIDNYTKLLFN